MLIELFIAYFKIGLFSFGGGLAALPLIQNQIVDTHGWLTLTEFTDLVTIAQMTPGPIALNAATFVGLQISGIQGALIATLGCILPSVIMVSILLYIYNKYKDLYVLQGALQGLRPAVVALVSTAGITIATIAIFGETKEININNINYLSIIIFTIALIILRKYKKINPVYVMLLSGIIGGLIYYIDYIIKA